MTIVQPTVPLLQGRWTSDQLHWGGIDHMLLQGQPATAEACTSVAALSDSDLNDWLHNTSAQAVQRAQARHNWCQASAAPDTAAAEQATAATPHAPASTVSPQPIPVPVSIVTAASSTQQQVVLQRVSQAPEAADTSSVLPEGSQAQAMQVDADQNLLGMSAAAEAWFNSFETMQPAQFSQGSVFEAGGGRGKARCWGPPLPAHLPAMLRGTLAQAVLGGIAGKSLVNQVSRCLQCDVKCVVSIMLLSPVLLSRCTCTVMILRSQFAKLPGANTLHVSHVGLSPARTVFKRLKRLSCKCRCWIKRYNKCWTRGSDQLCFEPAAAVLHDICPSH